MDFELDFRVGFSSWIFELDFRVGYSSWPRVGFSSWIFELDIRFRIFLARFGLVGFPINFQCFYTTHFVSGVAQSVAALVSL